MTTDQKPTRVPCAGKISEGMYGLSKRPCSLPAKLHENGKDWCTIHAPSAQEARQKKRDADYLAERDRARSAKEAETSRLVDDGIRARVAALTDANGFCMIVDDNGDVRCCASTAHLLRALGVNDPATGEASNA